MQNPYHNNATHYHDYHDNYMHLGSVIKSSKKPYHKLKFVLINWLLVYITKYTSVCLNKLSVNLSVYLRYGFLAT